MRIHVVLLYDNDSVTSWRDGPRCQQFELATNLLVVGVDLKPRVTAGNYVYRSGEETRYYLIDLVKRVSDDGESARGLWTNHVLEHLKYEVFRSSPMQQHLYEEASAGSKTWMSKQSLLIG